MTTDKPSAGELLARADKYLNTGPGEYASEIMRDMAEFIRRSPPVAGAEVGVREAATKIAAECHRAKWQFDLNEDFQPSKTAARALILQAFHELHRIGDLALKLRDNPSSLSPPVAERGGGGAGEAVTRSAIKAALREHWITSVNCDKQLFTNRASCSCSVWAGQTVSSLGAAIEEWIDHVLSILPTPTPETGDGSETIGGGK